MLTNECDKVSNTFKAYSVIRFLKSLKAVSPVAEQIRIKCDKAASDNYAVPLDRAGIDCRLGTAVATLSQGSQLFDCPGLSCAVHHFLQSLITIYLCKSCNLNCLI